VYRRGKPDTRQGLRWGLGIHLSLICIKLCSG
jgi:hypothetical protein